ncbi:MAG: tetratricopeptide repeat protein [Tannerellaceae bacterium]|jgi:tetratricopeptide (TPR) repeat protein|nr:tetratricopeptide repeat protein [Tannerellaceae bacterium]
MKKLIVFIICGLITSPAIAKKIPKWMEKSRKAVLRVTTFDKDGRIIRSSLGFYVSETGEALSAYSIFNGADSATVTDTDGNTYPVASVIGADDLYDVIRFRVTVPKKVPFLVATTDPVPEGTGVFLLPYSAGKTATTFQQGVITEVSKLKDPYSYYKLSFPLEEGQSNAPLLLADGQVFALAQDDASGKNLHSYGVSATYVRSLGQNPADVLHTVYTRIGLRKDWPEDVEEAAVSLFLLSGRQDAGTYLKTLHHFIATFPDYPDGYFNRASHYTSKRSELADNEDTQAGFLSLALADLQTATLLSRSRENPPAYHELEGDIYFLREDFPAACEAYKKINATSAASHESYYKEAKALEQIPGAQIADIITLLDGAISKFGDPLPREAAPYLLERVEHKIQLSLFSEAVEDYNLYYALTNGEVNDAFYFYREQARFRAGDHEGALQDINQAIALNAEAPDYFAEQAAVYVRLLRYDEALESVRRALDLAPDFAACYRIRGVCHVRNGKASEACEDFHRAKDLGDPLVARLIREHCR